MLYEQKVEARVELLFPDASEIFHGYWFNWRDRKAKSWCQPDVIVIDEDFCWIFEAKRTYTDRAWKQLQLYSGLCSHHFNLPVISLQVAQFLGKGDGGKLPPKVLDPYEAMEMDGKVLWHYTPR